MPNNKVLAAFVFAAATILYCAYNTLVQPTTAQRIEREFGVTVARFR